MTMATYKNGPRWSVQTLPGGTVNVGDVIAQGNLTLVADCDDPIGSGLAIVQTALWIGGIYQMAADAAYANGTYVFWNATSKQITTVQVAGQTYPFGWIVAGPNGLLSDGGPIGAASLCFVKHDPFAALFEPSLPTQYVSIASGNGVLAAGQMEGAAFCALLTSGATSLTTRTAAQLLAAIPNAVVGTSWVVRIINTNAGTLTIVMDASITATGTLTIATNTYRDFLVTITSATTATMKQIGTGTTS